LLPGTFALGYYAKPTTSCEKVIGKQAEILAKEEKKVSELKNTVSTLERNFKKYALLAKEEARELAQEALNQTLQEYPDTQGTISIIIDEDNFFGDTLFVARLTTSPFLEGTPQFNHLNKTFERKHEFLKHAFTLSQSDIESPVLHPETGAIVWSGGSRDAHYREIEQTLKQKQQELSRAQLALLSAKIQGCTIAAAAGMTALNNATQKLENPNVFRQTMNFFKA